MGSFKQQWPSRYHSCRPTVPMNNINFQNVTVTGSVTCKYIITNNQILMCNRRVQRRGGGGFRIIEKVYDTYSVPDYRMQILFSFLQKSVKMAGISLFGHRTGSGSCHQEAKKWKKNLDFYCFVNSL